MGASGLSSRAIIGEFYKTLNQDVGAGWVNAISMLFTSDQDSETYKWLGQTPAMREWVGGRNAKGFRENGLTITNKHYEATMEVLVKELRRDKTGQILVRIREMAKRTNSHWASLLSTLLINAPSATCYDGQYFFDTDHSEGDSGTQSNDIEVDLSTLACAVNGTITAPSVPEFQICITRGIQQIASFVDDQGEPMNEDARNFIVMVPVSLMNVAMQACATPAQVSESQTVLSAMKGAFSITPVTNARLDWTDEFAVIRTDGSVKPFIRQQETAVKLKAKADGSEFEFDNDAHQYGVDTWRNVGYGYWQHACLVTMT